MDPKNRPKIPNHMIFVNYFGRVLLIIFGLLSDLFCVSRVRQLFLIERNRESYPRLYGKFFCFYYRNITARFWNVAWIPIGSIAAEKITILERKSKYELTGRKIEAINFGSYNYLGYSQNSGPITDSVEEVIKKLGVGVCSSGVELGRQQIYCQLESLVAKYLGTEDAVIFGMGFGTNAFTMSALFGKGCLVISDELNHASLILGCRVSGAVTKIYKHNDMNDLEQIVRNSIIEGQPKTGRVWKKIFIIAEGIYSMEGTIVNLPEILRIKKKYKIYVYLDEAHSIGAIGKTGRGVCEYFKCDPKDIDILMGTFTKSFASAGGYIGGNRAIIQYIRSHAPGFIYAQPIAPPIVQQIAGVINEIIGNKSQRRIRQLKENTIYFRQKLIEKGYHIDGDSDSPVIPLMAYSESYLMCFLAKILESGIAAGAVSYPITPLLGVRARMCISAAHTRQMLDYAIDTIDRIGSQMSLNFSKNK